MLKPITKALAIAIWSAISALLLFIAQKSGDVQRQNNTIMLCMRGILYICGIRVTVTGAPVNTRPALIVSNHISYLDIPVLGSQAPVRFTPKNDIAQWPAIGTLCRLCDVVFIDRRRSMVKPMKEALCQSLKEGKMISLFPEATTGDGVHMHSFKPGFFDLAEEDFGDATLTIQPVALTYTKIRKLPIDHTQWPEIAWYGDMDFAPHFFNALSLSPIDAELVFLPPIEVKKGDDRKELAALCQKQIEEAIDEIRSRQAVVAMPKAHLKAAPALKIQSK
jgi:lyso-ornithine lipid O-acyltransferase